MPYAKALLIIVLTPFPNAFRSLCAESQGITV
jgi:hypothetical protein